ncbi:TRAP transporter small permease [Arsenicitalea aurantiaca]|nr:TRAP transporter small permease subunit [Arsenicitalea aurantiaca]
MKAIDAIARFYVRVVDGLARLISPVLGALFILLAGLVVLQILGRMARVSLPWTEELGRMVFIYIIYLGASSAYYDKLMITIDTVPEIFPRLGRILQPLVAVTSFLIVSFLFVASFSIMRSSWNTSLATLGWVSNGWFYVAFALGFGLMIVYSVAHLAKWHLKLDREPGAPA